MNNTIAIILSVLSGLSTLCVGGFLLTMRMVFKRINDNSRDIRDMRDNCANKNHISTKTVEDKIDKSVGAMRELICNEIGHIKKGVEKLNKHNESSEKWRGPIQKDFKTVLDTLKRLEEKMP